MIVAPRIKSHGKSNQATFLKVGPNVRRTERSEIDYGSTEPGGKQFLDASRDFELISHDFVRAKS